MKIRFGPEIFYLHKYGGISKYISRLCEELVKIGIDSKIIAPVYVTNEVRSELIIGKKFPNFRGSHRLYSYISKQVAKHLMDDNDIDVYHQSYYSDYGLSKISAKKVVTIHDMAHEKIPLYFSPKDMTPIRKLESINNSDRIICISNSTKKNLLGIYPHISEKKISVIHLGYDQFNNNNDQYQQDYKKIYSNYILFIGNRGGYKNYINLIKAISYSAALKNKIKIILFGGGNLTAQEMIEILELGFNEHSIECVQGDNKLLQHLYANAVAFIYPSIHEGFGLPLLEAMGSRCPVLCSNIDVFREVAGDAALYFSPYETDSIACAIEKILSDNSLRKELILKGLKNIKKFNWSKCASETLRVYEEMNNE